MAEPLTDPERLALLEQAALLHSSAQRRHSEALDRHAEHLARHDTEITLLRQLLERQAQTQQTLADMQVQMQTELVVMRQTLEAIKDVLGRGNGH